MSEKTERAREYFSNGFNCAQAVFAPFAEDYDVETEAALRIAGAFGGGMKCGEMCGAVSGGVMVVGSKHGQYIPNDLSARQISGDAAVAFINRFREKHGCLLCRELLGVNPNTPEGHEKFVAEGMSEKKCRGFVEDAVELLEDMGY